MMGLVGVVLHYVTEGPRRVQPQPPVRMVDTGDDLRRPDGHAS